MKAELVKAASEVITNQQILVNRFHAACDSWSSSSPREYAGAGAADIALTEIANGTDIRIDLRSGWNRRGCRPSCSSPLSRRAKKLKSCLSRRLAPATQGRSSPRRIRPLAEKKGVEHTSKEGKGKIKKAFLDPFHRFLLSRLTLCCRGFSNSHARGTECRRLHES